MIENWVRKTRQRVCSLRRSIADTFVAGCETGARVLAAYVMRTFEARLDEEEKASLLGFGIRHGKSYY